MIVRVAFRYGDTRLFSRLVCFLRGGDSAHCEVATRLLDGSSWCVSSSFLDGGVRGKDMPLPAEKWRIYEVAAAILGLREPHIFDLRTLEAVCARYGTRVQ